MAKIRALFAVLTLGLMAMLAGNAASETAPLRDIEVERWPLSQQESFDSAFPHDWVAQNAWAVRLANSTWMHNNATAVPVHGWLNADTQPAQLCGCSEQGGEINCKIATCINLHTSPATLEKLNALHGKPIVVHGILRGVECVQSYRKCRAMKNLNVLIVNHASDITPAPPPWSKLGKQPWNRRR